MSITTGIIFLSLFVAIFIFLYIGSDRKVKPFILSDNYRQLLLQYVHFYNHLYDDDKRDFEKRMQSFLSTVRITGVNTTVEDIDRVFIAASAIIPIFHFKNWMYPNLNEVLLYPAPFNEAFKAGAADEQYGGMVGWGALQNSMAISKPDLHSGFLNSEHGRHTGIHEFVHLIDKTDGATDGIPENIMDKGYIIPWLQLIQKEIKQILEGQSIIHPYGATNEAEFFAVASEYFFAKPQLLKSHHPELYNLLEKIFNPQKAPSSNT